MRKETIKMLALATIATISTPVLTTSCSDDDTVTTERNWSTDGGLNAADNLLFNDSVIGNGDNEFVFNGTQTLKKGTYLLKGWVYIADGATLTIEPGTIIKGDKQTMASLIVERGGKLIAKGTASEPIVFTSEQAKGSRKPGDWGGIIICGKASHNAGEAQIEGGPRTKHGGSVDTDNSGVLSYVRIEFAGYPFATDQEINGLTLGSVGSGTQIDHVQVSYSNDDSFEWFGGTVNAKYLVAYNGWDDDFDTDNGYSGTVQYGLVVRNSKIADKSQSNGFESDNDASGSTATPVTSATFSNITFIGPKAVDANFVNSSSYITGGDYYPNNGSGLGRFQAAMQIRRGSCLNCVNSVAMGYPIGLMLDGEKGNTQAQAKAGKITLQNIWFADVEAVGSDANKYYGDYLVTGYDSIKNPIIDSTQTSFSSTFFRAQAGNQVTTISALNLTGSSRYPGLTTNFMPQSSSPMIGAASFTAVSGRGFDEDVNYIGAFSANDTWMDGWTNFDPNNTDY
ncbi:MAG: hypothetical protein Q4E59_07685 [Bacteroidales bacterium]|nr:hypothetical protein [Bacteroidales bacterium]